MFKSTEDSHKKYGELKDEYMKLKQSLCLVGNTGTI